MLIDKFNGIVSVLPFMLNADGMAWLSSKASHSPAVVIFYRVILAGYHK